MSQPNYKLPEGFKESNLFRGKWRYKFVTNQNGRMLFIDERGNTLITDKFHYLKSQRKDSNSSRLVTYFGRYK